MLRLMDLDSTVPSKAVLFLSKASMVIDPHLCKEAVLLADSNFTIRDVLTYEFD